MKARPDISGFVQKAYRAVNGTTCAYCSRQAHYSELEGWRVLCGPCATRVATGQVRLVGTWYERSSAFKRLLSSKEWRDSTVHPMLDGSVRVTHRGGATMTLHPSKATP
jgi:hypothetical protein